MRTIIPSITTIGLTASSWLDKISEIKKLELRAVGLFLTCLDETGRKQCYEVLKEMQRQHFFTIPFVHATSTMHEEEFHFLIKEFKTDFFNLHPTREYPLQHNLSSKLRQKILIENSGHLNVLTKQDLVGFGGLCLDLSHLEDSRRTQPEVFEEVIYLATKFPVLANHISAVSDFAMHGENGSEYYSTHELSLGSVDYLSGLPSHVISNLCAMELEDSLSSQTRAVAEVTAQLDYFKFNLAA